MKFFKSFFVYLSIFSILQIGFFPMMRNAQAVENIDTIAHLFDADNGEIELENGWGLGIPGTGVKIDFIDSTDLDSQGIKNVTALSSFFMMYIAGGTSILCMNQISGWLYTLGGIFYLFAEHMSTGEYQSTMEQLQSQLDNSGFDATIESANLQADIYDAAYGKLKTRVDYMEIAQMVMIGASVMAAIEAVMHYITILGYNGTCQAGTSADEGVGWISAAIVAFIAIALGIYSAEEKKKVNDEFSTAVSFNSQDIMKILQSPEVQKSLKKYLPKESLENLNFQKFALSLGLDKEDTLIKELKLENYFIKEKFKNPSPSFKQLFAKQSLSEKEDHYFNYYSGKTHNFTEDYLLIKEWSNMNRGEIKSISLNEYNQLAKANLDQVQEVKDLGNLKLSHTLFKSMRVMKKMIGSPEFSLKKILKKVSKSDLSLISKASAGEASMQSSNWSIITDIIGGVLGAMSIFNKAYFYLLKEPIIRTITFTLFTELFSFPLYVNQAILAKILEKATGLRAYAASIKAGMIGSYEEDLTNGRTAPETPGARSLQNERSQGEKIENENLVSQSNKLSSKLSTYKMNTNSFDNSGTASTFMEAMKDSSKSLSNGNLASGTAAVEGVNTAAFRKKLKNVRKKLLKRVNNERIKNGKKPFNYGKLGMKIAQKLKKSHNKMLSSLSPSAKNLILSAVNPPIGPQNNLKDIIDGKISKITKNKKRTRRTISKGLSSKSSAFNFSLDDEKNSFDPSKLAAGDKMNGLGMANKKYKDLAADSDVNDDPDGSIFNLITKRYIRSAYPVFFKVNR